MGLKDTAAIEYFADNEIFADAFNYYFFGSRKVIKPEELQPLDSAQAATIFGTRGQLPVKRYRDILKLAKKSDKGVFVLLGMELQSEIDYGMTVRNMLYDALSYDAQIKAIENQHEQQKKSELNVNNDNAGLTSEQSVNNIKGERRNSSAEFLSGMTKEDKLKPVVTLVINLSGKPWDGPRELLDLLDIKKDDALRPFLNNYKLHIISPDMMDDKEFLKFSTLCGFALNVLKYRYDGKGLAASIRETFGGITADTKTKRFLKTVTKSKILEELTKEANMVMDAFDQIGLEMVVVGTIDAMKNLGNSDEDIVNFVTKRHHVTPDYVRDLLKVWPQPLLDFNINKAHDNDPASSVPAGS